MTDNLLAKLSEAEVGEEAERYQPFHTSCTPSTRKRHWGWEEVSDPDSPHLSHPCTLSSQRKTWFAEDTQEDKTVCFVTFQMLFFAVVQFHRSCVM